MIQRFIYTALREGIESIQADPTILDDVFVKQLGVTDKESSVIKTIFAAKPPQVIHGFARSDSQFPLYSVVLVTESEADKFLADEAAYIDDEDDADFGRDTQSVLWQHSFQIVSYADHPDVAQYYYEISKAIMGAARSFFVDNDIMNPELAGMDLNLDPRYVPEHLFARALTFNCKREYQRLEPRVQRAFKVSGIYLDSSGSTSDVGDVKTLVTVNNQTED